MQEVGNAQRAFWSFLITTLAAPFLGGLLVLILSVVSGALDKGPESLKALDAAGQFAWAAEKAIATFVWSAIPAAVAATVLAIAVYLRGTYSWLMAAITGSAVVAAGAFFTGGIVAQHGAPVAFIGGIVGIVMWAVLRRAGILSA